MPDFQALIKLSVKHALGDVELFHFPKYMLKGTRAGKAKSPKT
jgi:hypothetical protein